MMGQSLYSHHVTDAGPKHQNFKQPHVTHNTPHPQREGGERVKSMEVTGVK